MFWKDKISTYDFKSRLIWRDDANVANKIDSENKQSDKYSFIDDLQGNRVAYLPNVLIIIVAAVKTTVTWNRIQSSFKSSALCHKGGVMALLWYLLHYQLLFYYSTSILVRQSLILLSAICPLVFIHEIIQ